jgi:hypothetical protein
LAARGNAAAIAALWGPQIPEELEYLRDWAYELVGRSGVGMGGAAPLSYTTIRDWALLTHRRPAAWEVDALIRLDAVIRHPDAGDDTEE